MISIIPPQSAGEWLAWSSAAITFLFGLTCFLAPGLTFRILRLRTEDGVPEAVAESRGTMAGFYFATSICAILFAQPFLWMVLGAGWAFTAVGRLVSMILDRGFTAFNAISIVMEIALAAAPLVYVFGILP